MHHAAKLQTPALWNSINKQPRTFGKSLAVLSSVMLLLAPPLFAADSLFEVVSPKANQEYVIGSTITVQWVMHNHAAPGGGVLIQLSPDDGITWFYINKTPFGNLDSTVYHDSIGTYAWTIVDSIKVYGYGYVQLASTTCNVQITAPYDDAYLPATSPRFSIIKSTHIARPPVNGNGMNYGVLSLMKGDQGMAIEVISLNGRARSTMIEMINNPRGSSASGVYILRPRYGAAEQATPWCIKR